MSLKEGYQPTKKQDLKVSKKKPNVLDKMPAKMQLSSSGGSKDSTPSPPGSPSPGISSAVSQRVEELVSELNKLKAIILKHEVRIRDLEKKVDQQNNDTNDNAVDVQQNAPQIIIDGNKSNGESSVHLPDEV